MSENRPERRVLRWDSTIDPDDTVMEFRLTYAGELPSHNKGRNNRARRVMVHKIRQAFHKQIRKLWEIHPVLGAISIQSPKCITEIEALRHTWVPIVTEQNGLICRLDILLLRDGPAGNAASDIDNKAKTIFDALSMPRHPQQLGKEDGYDQIEPSGDEKPFYVLLSDDKLITHVSITSDSLLEPVPDVPPDAAARLVVDVTIKPYHTNMDNLDFV